jgi:hypothetical protein
VFALFNTVLWSLNLASRIEKAFDLMRPCLGGVLRLPRQRFFCLAVRLRRRLLLLLLLQMKILKVSAVAGLRTIWSLAVVGLRCW